MAHSVQYITYYIVLRDPVQVAALQAQFPFGYQFAPYNPALPGGAAIAFNASWSGTTDAPIAPFVNYVWSPEWTAANAYPQDVATFTRHTGGVWGIGGTTVTYYWVGRFVYKAPDAPAIPPATIANIPRRRFIEGFEHGGVGPIERSIFVTSQAQISLDASRHVGGHGLAIRGWTFTPLEIRNDKYRAGFTTTSSWERMYLRCRAVDPAQDMAFWDTFCTESPLSGVQLRVASAGAGWTLAVYRKVGGVFTFKQAVGALRIFDGTDLTWDGFYKVDLLIQGSVGGSGGKLRVYINGVLTGTVAFTTAEGGLGFESGGAGHHRGSGLGNSSALASLCYLDFDDWTSADIPTLAAVESLTSRDWLAGTKIAGCRPTTFGSGHDAAAWPGDVRILLPPQFDPINTGGAGAQMSSTTSGGVMEVNTDSDLVIDGDGALGCTTIVVDLVSTNAGGPISTGTLRPTAVPANTQFSPAVIQQTVARQANQILGTVDGTLATFPDWTPLKLKHTKSTDASASTVCFLQAQAELTGTWYLEDQPAALLPTPAPTFAGWKGQHNAPYPRSPWGKDPLSAPISPFLVYSGLYTGNGTAQDLNFNAPIHWIFIRALSGGLGGHRWWSTMLGGHRNSDLGIRPDIAAVDQDATFVPGGGADFQQWRYRIRVVGNDAQINANAVSYHYVAVSDPGMRFLLNTSFSFPGTDPSHVNNLVNSNFTPELGFFWIENLTAPGVAGKTYMKGPQQASAAGASAFNNNLALTAAITFGLGKVTTQANYHVLDTPNDASAASFWRRHDGNNDPGEPAVMAIVSWIGDGVASRTLSIAPASGKRPIFAIATGDDSLGGYMRDASHTTNTSTKYEGTLVTTAITGGGIDSISIGALLNVNGVNYNMLVLIGDATAGNGGFGVDGNYVPVEADHPVDGPYAPAPDPSVFNPVPPPVPIVGEPDLDLLTVLSNTATMINGFVGGSPCETYTRKIVNIALSRIGISQVINNLATDNTQAAVVARRHVLECVNATLRAFDWPFATAYATLVLVGGTSDVAVNTDWQYSYRAPNQLIKARRIVGQNQSKRGFDPQPIEFKLTSDSAGSLIFCDSATTTEVPLVLEYTTRVSCPCFFGDPMFRDALAWRIAAELAPSLSRDEKRQTFCLQMFATSLGKAEVPAAQEQQQPPDGNASWINFRESGSMDFDAWRRQQ
jgi:hypothetical protein